jgi:hypothetical protein
MRSMPARDLPRLQAEIAKAKKRFGLPAQTPVRSCYEAGRDGFWLHRQLTAHGVVNSVVDSSSIEVNRRQRRAKTDRLDAAKAVSKNYFSCSGDGHASESYSSNRETPAAFSSALAVSVLWSAFG